MIERSWPVIVGCTAFLVLATYAWSKPNNPNITLRYTPQQSVGASRPTLDPNQVEMPARLRLVDKRPAANPQEIGQRTDDDDRVFALLATTSVAEFVDRTLVEIGGQWGILAQEGTDLLFEGKLLRFEIHEENQAVGATFNGTVGLAFDLQWKGVTVWSGTATGDATRYGRKFSNENCNEVLSDALLEAFAKIGSNPQLHAAWAGRSDPASVPRDEAISPEELLAGVAELMHQFMSPDIIVTFIGKQRLSRNLTAGDLAA